MKVCGPGEILMSEFIIPLDLAAHDMAYILHCTPKRATDILNDKVSLTQKEARWIGERFGTSAEFWMNLQNNFDAQKAIECND
jgi:antitoxin HigA-1